MIVSSLSKLLPISKCNSPIYPLSHQSRKQHFFKLKDQKPSNVPVVHANQYPQNLVDAAPMIQRGRPVRFTTPRDDIPELKMMSNDDAIISQHYNNQWKSPENSYILNVGLIGPVNSGKSQLMSKLGIQKVSSVSPKRNTTDQVIHAFKSIQVDHEQGTRNVQLKYYDTPGLTHNKTGFLSKGWKVLGEIDFSLLIIDSSKKFDDLLEQSIKRLQKHRRYQIFMKALVLNKIDLVDNKRKFHGLIAQIQKYGKFDKIFYTSALTGYGVQDIQRYLLGMARKGQWQHPKESFTDSSEHEVIQQMFKQALFHRTYCRLPYQTIFECQSIAKKSDGSHFVQFRVIVDSQIVQRMIIGKKGRNVNWMREYFKASYAKQFGVQVEVHVRVSMRSKKIFRGVQQVQSSYLELETKDRMRMLREELIKKGKFIQQ